MNSVVVYMLLLLAMPSALLAGVEDDLKIYNYISSHQLPMPAAWVHKRTSGLCDYRLQLRPLPLTQALCSYGS